MSEKSMKKVIQKIIYILVLFVCIALNFFSRPASEIHWRGFFVVMLGALVETIASMAIPLVLLVLLLVINKIRGAKTKHELISMCLWLSLVFAVLHAAMNIFK
jgi:hypothetical protein